MSGRRRAQAMSRRACARSKRPRWSGCAGGTPLEAERAKIMHASRRSPDRRRDRAVQSTANRHRDGLAEVQHEYEAQIDGARIDALEPRLSVRREPGGGRGSLRSTASSPGRRTTATADSSAPRSRRRGSSSATCSGPWSTGRCRRRTSSSSTSAGSSVTASSTQPTSAGKIGAIVLGDDPDVRRLQDDAEWGTGSCILDTNLTQPDSSHVRSSILLVRCHYVNTSILRDVNIQPGNGVCHGPVVI
jgi:hypothetical protein